MSRNKPFYTDYVKHMMRFYSRSLDIEEFKSNADVTNWQICNATIIHYSQYKSLLLDIYSGYGTHDEEVSKASIKYNVDKKFIWDLMKRFEKDLAHNRGLI